MRLPFRILSVTLMITAGISFAAADDDPLVFVSAFAGGDEGAIHAYHFDLESGALKPAERTAGVGNPFFLALSPDHKFLYSIHAEKFGGEDHEEIAAYAIEDGNGKLKLLNRQSALGSASCYLDVDATGKALLVANYSTGSVASLPIKDNGSIGESVSFVQHEGGSGVDPKRQKGPYAHSIVISPDNRFAYAADLGLDQVLGYRLDPATAKIVSNEAQPFAESPPGAGPRHLTFHPNGKHLYAINELTNGVTRYDCDSETGKLTRQQTISTLPDDFDGKSYCADLKITPNGKFLYGTNRGHDSVAAYRIGDDGALTLIEIEPSLGKGPQNLAITPDGRWLLCANLPDSNLAVFQIDPETGELKSKGEPIATPKPSCIMLVP